MLASLCVYHGGIALNDWADRDEDARDGRGRPLATGALSAATALALASGLLLLGPLIALLSAWRCGLVLAAVAVCAALYDLAGRGPWRGPFLLAACRAGNLGAGLALASTFAAWRPILLLAPLAYGGYVFLVSRLARLEDVEGRDHRDRFQPGRWTVASGLGLLAIGVVAVVLSSRRAELGAAPALRSWTLAALPLVLVAWGSVGLFRLARGFSGRAWAAGDVQRAAGMALRRLLVASSALACGAGTPAGAAVALVILLGYPASFALRRVFPPT
jgi:4-hydroxybenzoate polyprenyltransferase